MPLFISLSAFCCDSYALTLALYLASAPFKNLHTSPLCAVIFLAKWSRCKTPHPAPDTKSALWLTTSADVFAHSGPERYDASHNVAGRSRWFVGSSSSTSPGLMNSACASAARILQPPESFDKGPDISRSEKPRPARMRRALASEAYASRRSSSSASSPSLVDASRHFASSQAFSVPFSAASMASMSADSSLSSASTRASHDTSASSAERSPASSSCATHATSCTLALMRPDAMSLTSVDLPLPFAPRSATFCPRAILNDASSSRRTPRTDTSMPLTSTTASVAFASLKSSSFPPPPRTWTLTASRALAQDSGALRAGGPFRDAPPSSGGSSEGRRPSFSALASILRSLPVSLAPSFRLIIIARS